MRALVFLLLGSLLAAAADRALTGGVVDANTGEPIARAHLTLRFYQGGQPAPGVALLSDPDGSFRITNPPEGGSQVTCEKTGYLPLNQGMPPAPAAVELKLIAQAAIEGTVLDDKDAPVANTFIQLLRQQVVNGRREFQPANGGSTDETGYFRLFGLSAGRYYISIGARLSGARRAKPLAYPAIYYPNATEIAGAQPIDLKAGDEQQFHMKLPEPVPAFEIRGVVATASTNPPVGLSLIRQQSSLQFGQSAGEVNFDPKAKTFRISHVTPGIYQLTANVQDGRNPLQASTAVTVGNGDVMGIRLEPAESGIDGVVRAEGNVSPSQGMFVSLQSPRYNNGGQVDADGKFHIANVPPDNYRVVPQINSQQWCVGSIMQNGRDVRDGLTISAGVAPDPLEIALTSHCGSIDLTLASSDSPSAPNLTAFLLRKAGDEFVLDKQAYLGGRPDNPTLFLLQGIAPGDYVLYCWPQDAQIEYTNAEYMRQFESYGKAVTVTADSKVSVTIDKVLLIASKN